MSLPDLVGKKGLVAGIASANSILLHSIAYSRADTVLARTASCVVALFAARRGPRAAP